MKTHLTFFLFLILFQPHIPEKKEYPTKQTNPMESNKFEPNDGECLFFIGQDLEAVGGFTKYNEGYVDTFNMPAGVTVYTNLASGGSSFGYYFKGLDGIKTKANWGAGATCAQYYIEDPKFKNCTLAIGLSLVDEEKNIAKGKNDQLIREFGMWIKETNRPIFLRIGYEFDGWDWNHYDKKYFLKAWKRIHRIFKEMNVTNVAYVWQSKGTGSNQEVLEEWYPGDDFVDWCGYSYFGNPDTEMITFARKHQKPVFIAEATPVFQEDTLYFDADLSKEKVAIKAWNKWFTPFFKLINENQDIVKAFSYINVNWPSQPMWIDNLTFQKVDSRIQNSEYLSKKWLAEISQPRYLKATDGLFSKLGH